MTTAIEIKALMQPYAEASCPGWPENATFHGEGLCPCDGKLPPFGTGYDPRFDALRGEHLWNETGLVELVSTCHYCGWSDGGDYTKPRPPHCLRTDLGALVRVAAACGLVVCFEPPSQHERRWLCSLSATHKRGRGNTPEDALAQLIVAAVPLGIMA